MKKMLPTFLIAAAIVLLAFFLLRKGGGISGAEAQQLVRGGAQLVDVRTPSEFAAGHIAGAINVPVQELAGRLKELEPKERALVVYCRSGSRSGNAARMLKAAGFSAVHDLGPMSSW